MSYATKDKSIHDGAPIECYEFIAAHKTWRLTSYHDEITVGGQLYTPTLIVRSALEVSSAFDSIITMDFTIACTHELARTFCFSTSPKELEIIVRRVHEGDDYSTDFQVEWQGSLSSTATDGKWAVIKTRTKVQLGLNGPISSVYYQNSCNHTLFDARCGLLRADFTETAIITKVQGQLITVDNMVFANDELELGEITNTRTGEVQGIILNAANEIRIGYPFFDLLVGDTVELTQGCNHVRLGHCKTRFNNVGRYGGFDFVPVVNPFEALNYSATTQTQVRVRTEVDAITQSNPLILAPSGRSS